MLDWSMRFYFPAITTARHLICCMLDVDIYISQSGPRAVVHLLDLDGREIALPAPLTNAGLAHLKTRVRAKLRLTGHARYWPLVHLKINDVFSTGSPDPWE